MTAKQRIRKMHAVDYARRLEHTNGWIIVRGPGSNTHYGPFPTAGAAYARIGREDSDGATMSGTVVYCGGGERQ